MARWKQKGSALKGLWEASRQASHCDLWTSNLRIFSIMIILTIELVSFPVLWQNTSEKNNLKEKGLFWLMASDCGQLTPLFLDLGKAEHCGEDHMVEQSCLFHGDHTIKRKRKRVGKGGRERCQGQNIPFQGNSNTLLLPNNPPSYISTSSPLPVNLMHWWSPHPIISQRYHFWTLLQWEPLL
jgi:hypothetical protein